MVCIHERGARRIRRNDRPCRVSGVGIRVEGVCSTSYNRSICRERDIGNCDAR